MDIRPYEIAVAQDELDDLHDRLARTRWPAALTDSWQRGTPVPYARDLAERWRTGYDWRAHEARLNAMPQFLAVVDGQRVHGLHVRSARDDATPLLLCHGYPTSFAEFARLAPALAAPADDAPAFHVVVPSIPGFGLSTPLVSHGWDIARTAGAFDRIMGELGYERYTVFGEDVGAGIVDQICLDAGERVLAALVATDPGAIATQYTPPTDHLTADERAEHDRLKAARSEDFGYLALQTTRPLSVAYGLTDSPAMQLTWIVEKFQEWTDPTRTLPEDAVDVDDLLTLVSVSWFGRAGDGAANLLWEAAHAAAAWGRVHDRPLGMAAFGEQPLMRRILDAGGRLAYWGEHARGGHFPAMEVGDDLAGDIRAFLGQYRLAHA
jgi:pimeloyl-ACP methyl ester carboxylesterase